MLKRGHSDPYQEFLSKHRTLATMADTVLEKIGEFSHLESRQDFLAAFQDLREQRSRQPEKRGGVYAVIEHQLRPSKTDNLTVRELALICRAAEVTLGYTPWHHQIIASLLLYQGMIVEMPNGAGKTLAASLAAGLNAIAGNRTHIATFNDYLSERDTRWIGPLYQLLGLSVGVIFSAQSVHFEHGMLQADSTTLRVAAKSSSALQPETQPDCDNMQENFQDGDSEMPSSSLALPEASDIAFALSKEPRHETTSNYLIDHSLKLKTVCACDVVYGRLVSFGFTYLRDNVQHSSEDQVLTQRDALIVDECDMIMLDDLSVPLVLSDSKDGDASGPHPSALSDFHKLAQKLTLSIDFIVDDYNVQLTYQGLNHIKELTGQDFFTDDTRGFAHTLINALKALYAYHDKVNYLVENGQIFIIETETGRILTDRRYSDGLHEALEVKEGLVVNFATHQRWERAQMTIKHFVRTYRSVSGMSGTIGSPAEYRHFYELQTVHIQPFQRTRTDHDDLIFRTKHEARKRVVEEAINASKQGKPVLINVPNLKEIDAVGEMLREQGAAFQALDARIVRNLAEEAEAVKHAAQPGAITVCSKLAARGTDIVISPEAVEVGGLMVIGLERGLDRRYDRQLQGRTGRHGNPGESLFILSLEDDLLKIFGSERISSLIFHLGMEEDQPIEHGVISWSIRNAQRKVQNHRRDARYREVEFDDILARHRIVFYDLRQKLLTQDDFRDEILTMVDNWVYFRHRTILQNRRPAVTAHTDSTEVLGHLSAFFDVYETDRIFQIRSKKRQLNLLKETLRRKVLSQVEHENVENGLLRWLILRCLDKHWEWYIQFERTIKEELRLYIDFSRATAVYYTRMEERFDAFFYEVGETILGLILSLSVTHNDSTSLLSELNHD